MLGGLRLSEDRVLRFLGSVFLKLSTEATSRFQGFDRGGGLTC